MCPDVFPPVYISRYGARPNAAARARPEHRREQYLTRRALFLAPR